MFLAIDPSGATVGPEEYVGAASCPCCKEPVVAKRGDIVSWHFAHKSGVDCDSWSEMSIWHRDWQGVFPRGWREVGILEHRADVHLPGILTVEFQASPISPSAAADRSDFYGEHGAVVWVFDCRDYTTISDDELPPRLALKWRWRISAPGKRTPVEYRWRHPIKAAAECSDIVYLDLGGALLRLQSHSLEETTGTGSGVWTGQGWLISPKEFVRELCSFALENAGRAGKALQGWSLLGEDVPFRYRPRKAQPVDPPDAPAPFVDASPCLF